MGRGDGSINDGRMLNQSCAISDSGGTLPPMLAAGSRAELSVDEFGRGETVQVVKLSWQSLGGRCCSRASTHKNAAAKCVYYTGEVKQTYHPWRHSVVGLSKDLWSRSPDSGRGSPLTETGEKDVFPKAIHLSISDPISLIHIFYKHYNTTKQPVISV